MLPQDGAKCCAGAPWALVALGGSLPLEGLPPAQVMLRALAALSAAGLVVQAQSRLYTTPCFPPGAGPDYVNAAARVDTGGLTPAQVLARLHTIEATFARRRDSRWGARTLDLDLIAMGDLLLPDAQTHAQWRGLPAEVQARLAPDQLILPHPRLQDRAFVLVPLADIAPDWRHPVLRQSVVQMRDALPGADLAGVRPL